MKKTILFTAFCCAVWMSGHAEHNTPQSREQANEAQADSLSVTLGEVDVVATRAGSTTPMAFTDIGKEELKANNHAKDIPSMLQLTPSVIATSDAGTGIGYTSLRIRGTDHTRINITTNGIPMNDAESGLTYFNNIPDFASNVQDIQIQRGVGTSTNGAGAFGASINMRTDNFSPTPWGRLAVSYGTYATNKESLQGGSGFLSLSPDSTAMKVAVEGRLSYIGSDGYIDRAFAHEPSLFVQAGLFSETSSLKFITFNGREETYHAWDYISKEDWRKYGRHYNPAGRYVTDDGDTAFYANQTDNYHQQHYQLHGSHIFSQRMSINAALHYTHGFGYYEQYKCNQHLEDYGLHGDVSDLVRRKNMKNNFYGVIASLQYKSKKIENITGGGWNKYYGSHYGDVLWVRNDESMTADNYYRNVSHKYDFNIYDKLTWALMNDVYFFADLQYRFVDYTIDGLSSQRIQNIWHFFNPKGGITWNVNSGNKLYASYAIAHKEPTRNDYEDAIADPMLPTPHAERLNDMEVGWQHLGQVVSFSGNLYYMKYHDQFVLTGAQDENGEFIASNIEDSYRMGIELCGTFRPFTSLEWNVSGTLSRNRAEDVHLSYSPEIQFSSNISYRRNGWEASFNSIYVGKQYMTNSNNEAHTLAPYFVSDLNLSKRFRLNDARCTVGITIYNIFNAEYESNGSAGDGWCVYSCQAPTHFLAHIALDI